MGGIHVSILLEVVGGFGDSWEGGIGCDNIQGDIGERHDGLGAPVNDTPFKGVAKILHDTFELGIMELGGGYGKFCESCNCISNIGTGSDICIEEELTKKGAVRKSHVGGKLGVCGCAFFVARRSVEGVDF